MSGLPSQTGGSLLPSFSSLPRLAPPAGDLASTRVPSLLTISAPALPVLCRDSTHATLSPPFRGSFYLSWNNSTISPGSLPSVTGVLDVDGDYIIRVPADVWQDIRTAFLATAPPAPAPVIQDMPVLRHVPTGQNKIFLCFGIHQDFSFSVPLDFPIEYIVCNSRGIQERLYTNDCDTNVSNHQNHRFPTAFRIDFIRT